MYIYRQSIIVFGILIPIVLAAVLVGVCLSVKSKFLTSADNKQQSYLADQQASKAALDIEKKIVNERQQLELWNKQLTQ
jgi:hypothetical protein